MKKGVKCSQKTKEGCIMAERIKQYLQYIDALLEKSSEEINVEAECKKHLVQIAFFAHERLIHLIVTVLFAILTMAVFLYVMSNPSLPLVILLLLLMVLLIPYIKHYYLLENSVQRMYEQYDKLLEKKDAAIFQAKYK